MKQNRKFLSFLMGLCLLSIMVGCSLLDSLPGESTPPPVTVEEPRYDYLIVLPASDTSIIVRAHPDNIKTVSKLLIPATIKGKSVVGIDEAGFQSCSNITELSLPSSVKKIAGSAFAQCTSLQTIKFSEGLTEIGQAAFMGCTALTRVQIPGSVSLIATNGFANCSNLNSLAFGSGAALEIGTRAFVSCGFSSLVLPSRVQTIRSFAFEKCRALTEVEAQGTVPPSMEPRVFGDTGLKRVTVPSAAYAAYKQASGWSTYASMLVPR